MDERNTATVPFFVHEGEMARAERTNKRLWILIIILILALIGTNAGWIYHASKFTDEEYTVRVEQDAGEDGKNNFNGNTLKLIGGNDYGETDNNNNGPEKGEN